MSNYRDARASERRKQDMQPHHWERLAAEYGLTLEELRDMRARKLTLQQYRALNPIVREPLEVRAVTTEERNQGKRVRSGPTHKSREEGRP